MKTKIIFVRHAEAVGNLIREFHGWTDKGITERGRIQAQKVALALKDTPVDVIYSSILKRTMETAEYISKSKGIPVIPRDDLKEINGGLWEGMPFADLPRVYPKEYATWETQPHLHQMPEGESITGFQQRVISAVTDIIGREKGKNICIVTHGTAIRVLLCWFKGWKPEQIIQIPWFDNTAVTIITEDEGRFDIELEGDASHLDEETSTFMNQRWYKEYREKFERENKKGGAYE